MGIIVKQTQSTVESGDLRDLQRDKSPFETHDNGANITAKYILRETIIVDYVTNTNPTADTL